VAKVVNSDPPMNFRFGLRIGEETGWRGFQRIEVEPTNHPSGPGVVHFEKALEPELLELVNLRGSQRAIIGVFHITDEMGGNDPLHRITLSGLKPERAKMSKIVLDAHGRGGEKVLSQQFLGYRNGVGYEEPVRSHHNMVLTARVSIPYELMEIKAREAMTEYRSSVRAVPGLVYM